MTFKVVRGYPTEEGTLKGEVCIYTLDGEKIYVKTEDIEKSFENEAPKGKSPGLSTFFIKPNAKIRIEVQLSEIQNGGERPDTITKWLDDGGTISKSRDDGYQPMTIAKYIDDGGTVRKSLDDF